jgi:tRNA threonylcarbamoyladenosine biosynthesis protein TsaE
MSTAQITTSSSLATESVGRVVAPLLRPGDILLLSGDLGAGKTQLVKGLAEGLGVDEPITSPTFNLLLVHRGLLPLYHFDLYRLDSAEQLEDLDYFGTLESDGVAAVEWGDRFPEALPCEYLAVVLKVTGDDERAIELRPQGQRAVELAVGWLADCAGLDGVIVVDADSR